MISVPDEAANHLGAILLAFNREIFGGFLDEADELAALGQVTSAVLIAGTVLEYVERSPAAGSLPIGTRSEIEAWRRLRNSVVHSSEGVTARAARAVVTSILRVVRRLRSEEGRR